MTTPKTASPELVESQADKEEDHNEAIRRVEAGARHFCVEDRNLTAPPGACADGATYIISGPSPTGAWASEDGNIAISAGANASNGWLIYDAEDGMTAWIKDESVKVRFDNATSPSTWILDNSAAGTLALDDLTDVDTSSSPGKADGDILTWNASAGLWVPGDPPSAGATTLDGLTDVETTGVADGDILVYEASPNGWRAVPRRLGQFWYDQVACSDEETALETGTLSTWRQIGSVVVDEVRASLTTAQAGGQLVIDIKAGGVSILSTLIMIDQGAKTSVGSSPQPVISDNVIGDNEELTIELVSLGGASPVTAAGLKVQLIGRFLAP
jgi:hypothetical protein